MMLESLRNSLVLCTILVGVVALGTGCSGGPEQARRTPAGTAKAHPTTSPALLGDPSDVVAILVTSTDCPIANAQAPQVARYLERFDQLGVRSYLVYPTVGLSREDALRHRTQYGLDAEIALDPDHVIVEHLDATTTPEAYVVDFPESDEPRIRYRGRVNDLYSSIGNRRDLPSSHDWRDAVFAIVKGGNIEPNGPEAIGCLIQRR